MTLPATDPFSNHELLDRTHIIMESVADHICDHPAIQKAQKKKAEKIVKLLWELYQDFGGISDE